MNTESGAPGLVNARTRGLGVTAVLLLIVGLIVSQLAARARRLEVIIGRTRDTWPGSMRRPNSPSPRSPRTPWSTTSAGS